MKGMAKKKKRVEFERPIMIDWLMDVIKTYWADKNAAIMKSVLITDYFKTGY